MRSGYFAKLSTDLRDSAILSELSGAAVKVWLALGLHVGTDGRCWPSITTLARITGYSRRHVLTALSELQQKGLVRVDRRVGPGVVNVYTMIGEWITRGESSAAAPAEPPPDNGTDQAMMDALIRAYQLDPSALAPDMRGRLAGLVKRIHDAGIYTVQDVKQAGRAWWSDDWRGKKGERPTDVQFMEHLAYTKNRPRKVIVIQ